MKKLTKILAAALVLLLIFAFAACDKDDTDKRLDAVKENYKTAGYTVTAINKNNDLVKDKENYLTEVEEIYSITKAATEGNTGETYVLFKFKDKSKAEALKSAYAGGATNDPKRVHCERLLLVGLNGTNVKPFDDAYEKDV